MKSLLQKVLERTKFTVQSYSGRGMLGKECLSVECSIKQLIDVLIIADLDNEARHELHGVASAFTSDSLGRGQIIYWRNIPFVSSETEGDE
jgi:hypothetical protein